MPSYLRVLLAQDVSCKGRQHRNFINGREFRCRAASILIVLLFVASWRLHGTLSYCHCPCPLCPERSIWKSASDYPCVAGEAFKYDLRCSSVMGVGGTTSRSKLGRPTGTRIAGASFGAVFWLRTGVGSRVEVSSEASSFAARIGDPTVESTLMGKIEFLRRCCSATASSLIRSSKLGRPSTVAFAEGATELELRILR